jgi:hypothetical protein
MLVAAWGDLVKPAAIVLTCLAACAGERAAVDADIDRAVDGTVAHGEYVAGTDQAKASGDHPAPMALLNGMCGDGIVDDNEECDGGACCAPLQGADPVTWTASKHVAVSENNLTKINPTPTFNAGVASNETIPGDGYVEFSSAEATTAKMAGLSHGNTDQGFADIDFAIYLRPDGGVSIREGGAISEAHVQTYVAGDVFRVQAFGGVVTYHKNGTLFYTSLLSPTFPLLVDTSLRDEGATITDVVLGDLQTSCRFAAATVECRGSAGVCDTAETCTGASAKCPTDDFVATGTECRGSAGICDAAEACTGASAECPADGLAASGTECRPSAGACDVAEVCSGAAVECPDDVVADTGSVCRPSAGGCDVAETCDGGSACPPDDLVAAGTECRGSAGACDVAEACSGTEAACPTDGFVATGTECRGSAGVCDVAEACTGGAAACPTDGFVATGTECRGSAGVCDVAEACTGGAAACPIDDFVAAGTECRGAAGLCDVSEACTGSAAACPGDDLAPAGTVCRGAVDSCDVGEACDGSATQCPGDLHVNEPPVVSAGPDAETYLPDDTVALAGVVSDDGCPSPPSLVTLWTAISGPGPVGFADPAAAQTTATFTVPGTYELELAATDEASTVTDLTTVIVHELNLAPVVDAGADQLVSQPQMTAALTATASDDGLPVGGGLAVTWTLASGPGPVSFTPEDAVDTTVQFGDLGTYVLRVTVTDSDLTTFDDVVVIVAAAPDVAVVDVVAPAVIGNTLTVSGTATADLTNLGGQFTKTFTVAFFEDRDGDGAYDALADNLLGTTTRAGLGAGETVTVAASVSGQVEFAGNLVHAWADTTDELLEPDETNNLGSSAPPCELQGPPRPFAPSLKWAWRATGVLSASREVQMTPAVVDLNADGVPDVVFTSYSTALTSGANLRAVDGRTGAELFTVTDAAHLLSGVSQLAVGDLDLDGQPEVVAAGADGDSLVAFEHDGTFKWTRALTAAESVGWGGPSIADLDGDGTPEILAGRTVLNADGTIRWTGTDGSGAYVHGSLTIAADLDLDGALEVIAGRTAYRNDGTVMWTAAVLPDGLTATGNFDADPEPEIVLAGSGQIWLLEHTGEVKWTQPTTALGGAGGPPTIADFDGDGALEIGRAGSTAYGVYETDGTLKWTAPIKDLGSNVTGASVFDLENDGSPEVAYADESGLQVFGGSDGALRFQVRLGSCTGYEYPVIADVDVDGRADIVAVANTSCSLGNASSGVYVFTDDAWVGARAIWNQHAYHVTNVNDDATIPAHEPAGAPGFRQNSLAACPYSIPDLTASYVRFAAGAITARIGNAGARTVPSSIPVAFYDGDPRTTGTLLGTALSAQYLAPGQYEDVTLTVATTLGSNATIWVVADDPGGRVGTSYEVNEANNTFDSGVVLAASAGDPDLGITAVDASGMTGDWQTVEVGGTASAQVVNRGAAGTGGFDVVFFADVDANGAFDAGIDAVLATTNVDGLASGEARTVTATLAGAMPFHAALSAVADGAGAVGETDETNNVAQSGASCASQEPASFAPVVRWAWTGSTVLPAFDDVSMTPVVIDLTDDGVADVAFTTWDHAAGFGHLRAVDGRDGSELFTVTASTQTLSPRAQLAAGDLDGDGRPEIVAVKNGGTNLLVFEHDGALKWQSPAIDSSTSGGAAIADLDADGVPEIIIGKTVIDSSSGLVRWKGIGAIGGPVSTPLSLVADLDSNGSPEVITGNAAYTATGTVVFRTAIVPDGFDAVANLDRDAAPEIAHVGTNQVRVLEHTGTVKWGPVALPSASGSPGAGGPPTIADFNGDGRMEIAVANATRLSVLAGDSGSVRWTVPIVDTKGGMSAPAAFDFDGDGAAELVHTDDSTLRILDGHDGAVLYQTAIGGEAGPRNPVIADLDGDGRAEIIAAASSQAGVVHGIRVLADGSWMGARPVWNQATYHVTNVDDDGTVPTNEARSWVLAGGYRMALATGRARAPDLTVANVRVTDVGFGQLAVTVRVGNAGAAAAPAGVDVTVHDGPASAGVLLGVVETQALASGAYEDVVLVLSSSTTTTSTIHVTVDADQNIGECDEANELDSGIQL